MTNEKKYLVIIGLFYCLIFFVSFNFPFFWDTILYSRIAHWFLENNFSGLIIPEQLDTGNQPFFSLMLAFIWKIFGKSLWISHLMMLPFLIGIGYQYLLLAKKYIPEKFISLALIFLLLEPTLLAQSTMVSLDVVIVFCYLLGLNGILSDKRKLLLFSVIGLSLTNLRGDILIVSLIVSHLLINYKSSKKIFSGTLSYFPGILIGITWTITHYNYTGWLFSPSEWTEHRQLLPLSGIAKNLLFIFQRFFDFGRIALVGFIGISLFTFRKMINSVEKELLLILSIPLLILTLSFIPFSNPIGHRYFLIVFILISLYTVQLLNRIISKLKRTFILIGFSIAVLIGHIFIYPFPYANGWDSFISHIPYFKVRDKMTDYIISEKIQPSSVAAGFPLNASYKYTNLKDENIEFSNKYFGGINNYEFVLFSNINNDFKPEEVSILQKWTLIKEFNSFPIFIRLYKNPRVRS